ncbi:hypothetical protein PFICI_10163 [Pestalotiopsis fici W106-1]|uniref:Uncharacterized protein n=1 Tax=Pestalotiopsis fici (strain W106-1 / CGMCC3.15140) TaxID=1229662 RepID=W3WYY2_PESFW|nr:uncharacterized protein PFICI_10163 [Pestalotiopsis fici W106-1]ETS78101.1 hypothetical protein PFICI_10163 [Pestalotiopsis fici W106-1]
MPRSTIDARRAIESLDEDDASSGSDNEEGIPARSPRKAPLSVTPTLSIRSRGGKRRSAAELLQSAESHKRRRTSSFAGAVELLRGPGSLQSRNAGSHNSSESPRIAQARVGDDQSSRDGHNVQHNHEDDAVDPAMVDLVNSLGSSQEVVAVADSQDLGGAHNRKDSNRDVSDIDLGHNDQEELASISNEMELGDTDLSHEPARKKPSTQDQRNSPTQIPNGVVTRAAAADPVDTINGLQVSDSAEAISHQSARKSRPILSPEIHEIGVIVPASPNGAQAQNASEVQSRDNIDRMVTDLQEPEVSSRKPKVLDQDRLSRSSKHNTPQNGSIQDKDQDSVPSGQGQKRDTASSLGTNLPVLQLVSKDRRIDENAVVRSNTDEKRPKPKQSKSGKAHEINAASSPKRNVFSRAEPAKETRTKPSPVVPVNDELDIADDEELFVTPEDPNIDAGDDSISDLDEEEEFDPNRHASQLRHDVRRFRDGQVEDIDDSAFFDAPSSDSVVTIQLPSDSFSQARNLMQRLGWSAISNNWEKLLTEKQIPETRPAQHMTSYLIKLGRVLSEAPSAADLPAQNDFLKEHSEMMKRYFSKIDRDVDNIRTHWLSFKRGASELNNDVDAQQGIAKDLVRLVIPLLIAILGRGWALGQKIKGSFFTDFTISILARLLGWTEKLYRPLMRELRHRPLRPESKSENLAREALGPILATLRETLNDAPNRLRQEEQKLLHTQNDRQYMLQMQERIKRRRQAQAEAEKKSLREHNRKAALALRGNLPNPRRPRLAANPDNDGVGGGGYSQPSNAIVKSDARKSRRLPAKSVELEQWRKEEEVSLIKHLKDAFDHNPPRLPKLSSMVVMIGHSGNEIKRRATLLLPLMFLTASPEKSELQIHAMTDDLISNWR